MTVINSWHGLRPFFASHARTSHIQVSVRTRTRNSCSKWILNATLYPKKPAENLEAINNIFWNMIFFCLLSSLGKKILAQNECKQQKYLKKMNIKWQNQEYTSVFLEKCAKCVVARVWVWPMKKGPRARTSHTCFRVHFARTCTRVTAYRSCACAHATSQPILCLYGGQRLIMFRWYALEWHSSWRSRVNFCAPSKKM